MFVENIFSMGEEIIIVKMTEVIDNWGREEVTENAEEIAKVLKDPETWTDDITFTDQTGIIYFIDDLIGETVMVGDTCIYITE